MVDTPGVAADPLPERLPEQPAAAGTAQAHAIDATMLRDRVTAAIGDLYLIGREVGRGGMAVVYAAEDVRLQRNVALKVLPPDLAFRPDVRERFVREAQTAARLNHPHIVPIYAVHEAQGMVCFAMSLVEGESLAARILREPRPSFAFVASMLEQMADALAYAHAYGVVHRDMKPDNVLIDQASGRAMVTDFGIARAAESGARLTQTGIAVGTPAFMSPEQAMGEKEVDGRSDIYAVGVIGYLMLAGRLPFDAASTPAMLMKHVSETPPPLPGFRPDAPRVLVEILERCLAKKPQDRWDSALQLRDTLRHIQRDGSLVPPPSAAYARGERLTDKFGHRAEDWAPRRVSEPSPAPRPLERQQATAAYAAAFDAPRVAGVTGSGPLASPAQVADRVVRFRRSLKWLVSSAVVGIGSLMIGVSLSEEVFIAPMLGGLVTGLGSLAVAGRHALALRRWGISPRAAWGEAWRALPAARDNRSRRERLAELVERVGGPTAGTSRYTEVVRNAADDRLVIQESIARFTLQDRALVPDVEPTADALLERIGAIASGLERLERDLPDGALADLARRIAAIEAEPESSPDRERRLSLLMRQRASLDDLYSRRDTMQRQLDSASVALRSLRFDIVKLRTIGVDAAGDMTSATEEARAVSRELGYVLDAAEESRRL